MGSPCSIMAYWHEAKEKKETSKIGGLPFTLFLFTSEDGWFIYDYILKNLLMINTYMVPLNSTWNKFIECDC